MHYDSHVNLSNIHDAIYSKNASKCDSNDKLEFGYASGNTAELYNCSALPYKRWLDVKQNSLSFS